MATIFPEKMNRVDPDEPEMAIATMDEYIRYMTERMEFANSNMSRLVTAAGTSNVGLALALAKLEQTVSALGSTVDTMKGDISGIQEGIAKINERLGGVDATLKTLDERVTKLENPPPPTTE